MGPTRNHRLRTGVPAAFGRPAAAVGLLVLLYLGVIALASPEGYLGTDTGAKVATLDRMVEDSTNRPDVGYWAEEWDPDGAYHPLFDTLRNDRGEWVNVTTLPMLLAARPLYAAGGYRVALLLPMLGGVAAALAARDIARRTVGAEAQDAAAMDDERRSRAGTAAFWVVGAASPVAVYAVDFWEHSIGAACMLWAIALLLRVVHGGPLATATVAPAVGAGVLFGASATMRAETFVVAFVAVGAACLVTLLRRRPVAAVVAGVSTIVGFAGPWLANARLESWLGGNSRTRRVSSEAQREFWTEAGERFEEAAITWFGVPGTGFPTQAVLGAVAVGSLLAALVLHRRGEERIARYLVCTSVAVYALFATSGLAFVPGALVASPVAVLAVVAVRDRNARQFLVPVALGATLLTWTFQLLGGAGPQWGGRYLLAPTLVLTALGAGRLGEAPRPVRRGAAGLAVAVTLFGAAWVVERTNDAERVFDELVAADVDVVVSTNGFFVREGGPAVFERRFLSLGRETELHGAIDVVAAAGLDSVGVLTTASTAPTDVAGSFDGTDELRFVGVRLYLHRYTLP